MKNIGKFIFSILICFFLLEFSTRTFLFFLTNIDSYKYGFKKTVVFEVVDLSKLQINIIDKKKFIKSVEIKKNNQKDIWLFGGSTTFGNSCEQGQSSSWPEEIYRINKNFNYRNFAFNGANSDQSSILLWHNIMKSNPKIILWAHKFNTLNVTNEKNYKNKKILKYEFNNSYKNNLLLNIKRINKTFIEYSLFYSLLDKIILRINTKILKPKKVDLSETDIKFALKNYEINTEESILISKKVGVREFYLVSLFYEGDWIGEKKLKYSLYDKIVKKLELKYFPFVKLIDVKVDTKIFKREELLCDSMHQKYEGNKLQADIIYKNLINKSEYFK